MDLQPKQYDLSRLDSVSEETMLRILHDAKRADVRLKITPGSYVSRQLARLLPGMLVDAGNGEWIIHVP